MFRIVGRRVGLIIRRMETREPAPPPSRRFGQISLVIVAAGLIGFGFAIAPSVKRSAAASELQRMGFEVGAPGRGGARGFRGWWDNLWNRWKRGTDPGAGEWKNRVRLMSSSVTSLDGFAPALVRFQPKEVLLGFCNKLTDVSALKAFPGLERLDFYACPKVVDLAIVSEFRNARALTFHQSPGLKSLDVIQSGAELTSLHVSQCERLADFNALRSLTSLRSLWLNQCDQLQNTDDLRGLTLLEDLSLVGCTGLRDVTGLHGLQRLKTVRLNGCSSLPAGAVAALRAALPGATVTYP